MKNKSGFSLIEVIFAITILGTMSALIATASSRALKAKRKIQLEVESVSALRDAIKIMRADIQLAYNHYDFEKEIFESIIEKAKELDRMLLSLIKKLN